MNDKVYLIEYWESAQKGTPKEELLPIIKEELENGKYSPNTILQFIGSVANHGGYNYDDDSIDLAMHVYDTLDLANWEQCALPTSVLRNFIETCLTFTRDFSKILVNAKAIYDVFKDVDDDNVVKTSVLNFVFDDIVEFSGYTDIEFIVVLKNYVKDHPQGLMLIPNWIPTLIHNVNVKKK